MNKDSLLHITTNKSCNLNCVYCCEGVRKNGHLIDDLFMVKHTDEIDRNIKVYKDLFKWNKDFSWVVFSSWEPTLNTNLWRYIKFAYKLWYKKIELVTNGIRISDYDYLNKLKLNWLNSIVVSVNCFDEKISKIVSWNNYDWKKTLVWIYNCIKLNLPIQVNIVINKHNLIALKNTLVSLKKVWANSVILSFIRYNWFDDKIYKWLNRIGKNSVNYEEFVNYFIKNNLWDILKDFDSFNFNDFPICILFKCSLGHDNFKKSKDFNFFDRVSWNFKELSEVWIRRTFLRECSSCKYRKLCCWVEKDYLNIFWKEQLEKEVYPIN